MATSGSNGRLRRIKSRVSELSLTDGVAAGGRMAKVKVKNFGAPDELRKFEKGKLQLFSFSGATVGKEPEQLLVFRRRAEVFHHGRVRHPLSRDKLFDGYDIHIILRQVPDETL